MIHILSYSKVTRHVTESRESKESKLQVNLLKTKCLGPPKMLCYRRINEFCNMELLCHLFKHDFIITGFTYTCTHWEFTV